MRLRTCLLISGAFLVGGVGLQVFGEGQQQKPLGYWRFDEVGGLTIKDSSNSQSSHGNGRDGQILNESRGVKRAAGRSGGALEFAGGDPDQRNQAGSAALTGIGEIDWSKGITLEVWVRFTNLVRSGTYEIVSNTQSDRGPGFRFIVSWSSLGLVSGEGGDGKTWGAHSEPSATALKTGEWYHLAGTYDGSVFRVYVDGELAGASAAGLPLTRGDATLFLGAYRGGYAYGLDGVIDDLKVYNYARTAEEIVRDAKLGG